MNDLHPKSEELLVFSSINQSPPRRLGMPLETAEESDNLHLCGILNSCTKQISSQETKLKSAVRHLVGCRADEDQSAAPLLPQPEWVGGSPPSNMEVSVELGRYA